MEEEIKLMGLNTALERNFNLGIELGETRMLNNIVNILYSNKQIKTKKDILDLLIKEGKIQK